MKRYFRRAVFVRIFNIRPSAADVPYLRCFPSGGRFFRRKLTLKARAVVADAPKPVVYDNVRLKLADIVYRYCTVEARKRSVKPQKVYLSVAGKKLAHLSIEIFTARFFVFFGHFGQRSYWLVIDIFIRSVGIFFRMRARHKRHIFPIKSPIGRRIVKSDFKTCGAADCDVFAHKISSAHITFR